MKFLALAVLLVCVCSLEGALVKRETEQQVQASVAEALRTVQDYITRAHSYATDLAQHEKLEEIKTQAQTYIQTMREHVDPMATQLQKTLTDFLSNFMALARTYTPTQQQSS